MSNLYCGSLALAPTRRGVVGDHREANLLAFPCAPLMEGLAVKKAAFDNRDHDKAIGRMGQGRQESLWKRARSFSMPIS